MTDKKKPQKRARGRPVKVAETTKTITVRVDAETYSDLKRLAGKRMADTGESCSVSDVVRGAIERELYKLSSADFIQPKN